MYQSVLKLFLSAPVEGIPKPAGAEDHDHVYHGLEGTHVLLNGTTNLMIHARNITS
jgi:hypothetical protein